MATNREAAENEIAGQLAALKEDVAKLGETVKNLAARELRQGKERMEAAAGAAAAHMHDAFDAVRDRGAAYAESAADVARRQYHELELTIARNPLTAIGIAAAVGFLCGLVRNGGSGRR